MAGVFSRSVTLPVGVLGAGALLAAAAGGVVALTFLGGSQSSAEGAEGAKCADKCGCGVGAFTAMAARGGEADNSTETSSSESGTKGKLTGATGAPDAAGGGGEAPSPVESVGVAELEKLCQEVLRRLDYGDAEARSVTDALLYAEVCGYIFNCKLRAASVWELGLSTVAVTLQRCGTV